ncbi:hypothetical protein [Bradyrhizobium sp. SZCCHNRI2013]|uniref:hypothetical protein n=1 Tax=Bradyrhizobium sp. SZCCHNRI2013 TaxID=3057284 RepID=UPI002916EE51|nr:hypothetical protein [Bradyrhizobium sp. SZCCHNRI2013]
MKDWIWIKAPGLPYPPHGRRSHGLGPRSIPEFAHEFTHDLEAYIAARTGQAKDAIAVRQLRALREYLRPSDGTLRLTDVRKLMDAMAEESGGRPSKR